MFASRRIGKLREMSRFSLSDYRRSVQVAIRNNSTAFGFSVMITGSLAMISEPLGSPSGLEIVAFGLGAVAAFTVLDVIASEGFRLRFSSEPPEVVAHAAAISFLSVGLALGTAAGLARVLDGWSAWPVGAFLASAVFLLGSAVELSIAESVED